MACGHSVSIEKDDPTFQVPGFHAENFVAYFGLVAREFHVDVLLDMHESWSFYKDRVQNGTAFLGPTVATPPVEPPAEGTVGGVPVRIGSVPSA